MRPDGLFPLYAALTTLPGVGPKVAPLVEKVCGGPLVRDVALTLPTGVIDRRYRPTIVEAEPGRLSTIEVTVDAHEPGMGARPYRVRVSDDSGFLTLVFFNPNRKYLEGRLPVGERRLVVGEVAEKYNMRQMVHPARIMALDDPEADMGFAPVYPGTAGLSPRTLAKVCAAAATRAAGLPEWIDPGLLAREKWLDFGAALARAHGPEEAEDATPQAPFRRRLGYDELFARQLALQLAAEARKRVPGRRLTGDASRTSRLLAGLPYAPTGAQNRAFDDIASDMGKASPMLRLLQGDVGSGKTLVAAWAMARAAEAGVQSALMAPTDLLARQHFASLQPLLAGAGLKLALLTGKDRASAKRAVLDGLADGSVHAVCGTHALFQDAVSFADLGFIVVDEQHRFGVNDRRRLIDKGLHPHVLAMSATPIPRTLALAVYGDLDVSLLDEKPPGRAPVDTRALPLERIDEVVAAVARSIQKDDRVYWVCPLVEENEELDASAATERFADLQAAFGDTVALVHGKLKPGDKAAAMDRFREGIARILVATTVIEVGVDVPEASVMVIEHAERFGLAQLHQLRGRVGRGGKPGFCILLYKGPLTETATRRITILRETEDGFRIAEEDFELRGGGDLLGLRQSGLPAFKLADAAGHRDLLPLARDDARLLLHHDPTLTGPRGQAARMALHLFDQQDAEAHISAG
jgi:ATP-dependent DNA helicase RecG